MKTCTVCKTPKDEEEFYYDSATDTHTAKCKRCHSKFVMAVRQYKRKGIKLTTREFREQELYK